jgi:hypothetical protein
MNDHLDPASPADGDDDPVLSGAGARLRRRSSPISPEAVEVAALRRRARRTGVVAIASIAAVALLGGLLVARPGTRTKTVAASGTHAPAPAQVERLLASLAPQPIDPTKVQLVSSVSTFGDCNSLITDLRRVGAQHVGSRGFGDIYGGVFNLVGGRTTLDAASNAAFTPEAAPAATVPQGTTLGTNVQVEGVDELDHVKAVGSLVYDLDGKGNLRITDTTGTPHVVSTLDVTPAVAKDDDGAGPPTVHDLLVADGRIAIFGTETEVSKPVEGDPSATRATTSFMTVTFVDATDPAAPKITDRVRVEGSLVSARLVDGQIRLVTTSNMADLGFVLPTTPNSVPKALEQNRRSVAESTAADWIPDWQRSGATPEPLVPCERVHVPDTFSGVAMTSMVTFPLGAGRFEPAGTAILAPATTLYAGTDKVAISSEVWVDPADRNRLKFDDWRTAIHEFTFADQAAPTYEGSGIVEGSTIGQFAFGEVGDSLAVVTTKGTPWQQNPKLGVDLTILSPDGKGGLAVASKIADLADGKGDVTAVRFIDGRVLISTGSLGREVDVIDVSKPSAPRRAGTVTLHSIVGYFHPLPGQRALVIGSRWDEVGTGRNRTTRTWVRADLLDVSNADAPAIISTWERPWAADEVGSDHHAFTYWPERKLAMWGEQNTRPGTPGGNNAAVLGADGQITEVAVPTASKPNATPPPCPVVTVTNPDAKKLIPPGGAVLGCADKSLKEVDWPRYQCSLISDATVAQYEPDQVGKAAAFLCTPAPWPTVSRVLVVAGRPMLLTDQTLEVLDPATFRSVSITYHPTGGGYGPY